MVHPVPVPSPSPSAGSSSSYPSSNQINRKLNPNSQAFSFLQPDQVPANYHPHAQSGQGQGYDYPISNFQPPPAHALQHQQNPYYHQSMYPISTYGHKMGGKQGGGWATPHHPGLHSQHSHNSHSHPHSHSPYYHQQQPQQPSQHHHVHSSPAPPPPPPNRASNGIFLPLAHNGPHHLSSPSHSPYLASPPPIPHPAAAPANNSPQIVHPAFSPQRPLPPAAIHTPHLASAPSVPVSPATPLPPPSISSTSFFGPSSQVGGPNPVSFSTAPRLPPSQIQPSLPPHQEPPAPANASSTPSVSISQPPPPATAAAQQNSTNNNSLNDSQPPTRRHRKSRLPEPKTFPAITLGRGVKPPAGYKFPVFPDESSVVVEQQKKESAPVEEPKESEQEKIAEEPIPAKEEEVKVEEKEEEPLIAAEEKKEEPKPAVVEDEVEEPVKAVEPVPTPTPSVPEPEAVTPVETATPQIPATPAPAPTPKPASKLKSWADLVRPPPGSVPAPSSSGVEPISASLSSAPPPPATPVSSLLTALAAPPSHVHKPAPPLPRGLINNGNLCFANAILQALVYCGAFWETLRAVEAGSRADLRSGGQKGRSAVEAMIAFLAEFRNPSHNATNFDASTPNPSASLPSSNSTDSSLPSTSSTANASASSSRPSTSNSRTLPPSTSAASGSTNYPSLSPTPIHDALSSNPRFEGMRRGTQEDAEEFLGFFLETLSEEVLEIVKKEEERIKRLGGGSGSSSATEKDGKGKEKLVETEIEVEEEEGWEEVGSKGRTATTRTTGDTKESPITRIFGGKSRSVLRCPGQKDSVTIEPFQRLQLDIQPDHVRTIEDALLNLTTPESLPDYSTSRGTITQDATKQFTLDELPPVLILHLKRFLYDEVVGSQKCTKKIGYSTHLRIDEKVMSPARRNLAGGAKGKEVARYELFGVVYHHGLQASGGHYTVAVRTAYHAANWLELDDTHIRPLGPGEIAVNPSSSDPAASGGRRRWEATAAMRDREGVFGAEEEHKGAYLLMYARVDD
ncbi:hypothetical protein JCM16303_004505 [Sporobolomyces ruberrimus]